MSESLPSRIKELQAMSRQEACGCGSVSNRITESAGMEKKIVNILNVTVWHWHAKDQEPWVICS